MRNKISASFVKRFTVGVSLSVLCFSLPAQDSYGADEIDYFSLSPETLLSAQIVSASKMPEKVSDVAAAAYVLTNEDIVRSGVTTIPDALRMVPGVQVAQTDSNTWAISIRNTNSIFSNKLLVLVDGRSVYNSLFAGTFWELQDTIFEDIDRIEVIRGPGGTLWGANAVNGVINIITKNARDTQGGQAIARSGNYDNGSLGVRYGGSFDEGYYRAYAKAFGRDAFDRPDGENGHDAWGGQKAGFRADGDASWTVSGDVYRVTTEQQRVDFSMTSPVQPLVDQTIRYAGGHILGQYNTKLDNGSTLNVQSYLDYAHRSEPLNFVDDRITYDLETQYNLPQKGRHEIVAGAGYRFVAGLEEASSNTSFTPENRYDNLFSVFIQDKYTILPEKLFLTFGSKLEHNDYTGIEVQPSARLQWHPDSDQTVWSSIARAVRTPTPLETDVDSTLGAGPGVRAALLGNRDFESEELTAYEIGYRNQLQKNFAIDLATFYNDYDKLSTLSVMAPYVVNNGIVPPFLQIPLNFDNDMKGRSFGYELAAHWDVQPGLKLSANYSYLKVLLDAEDNSSFNQEAGEDLYSPHQFSLRAAWDISDEWTLDTAAYYVSAIKGNDVKAHVRVDTNIGYRLNDNLSFNLVGQNLLQGDHRELSPATDSNATEIPRSVFGKVTWKF